MKIDYGWKGPEDFRRWGPYWSFGTHAATEIRISWQSKFQSLDHWLAYGITPECKIKISEKISPNSMHCFILKDLTPDTTYYYKISRIEDLNTDPQPVYTFKTGPEEGKPAAFDFCIFADYHAITKNNSQETFESMARNVPNVNFVVSGGDCIAHGGEEERWNDFFHQMIPYTSKFAMMHTTGNHDTDHPETYAHFIQTFHHPYYNTELGAFYHFIYGNAVFLMLDSTNAGQTKAMQGVASDQQLEWIEETLEQYSKQNYWIFVVMHHPMYTTGDSGMMNIYDLAYRDLFDEHHVDAVFFGHDHFFEVYWTGREKEWGGTHYYLVGCGGKELGIFNRDATRNPPYHWQGRTYVPSRDGILPGRMEGMRNDDLIKSSYVYGIIETGFAHYHIDGDEAEVKMWGLQNQVNYKDRIKRTGCDKKYHPPEFIQEF